MNLNKIEKTSPVGMSKKSEQTNGYRQIVNSIEKHLRSKISQKRKQLLANLKKKMELWARMEEGDVDALAELSVLHGLISRERADGIKKESRELEEEGYGQEEA